MSPSTSPRKRLSAEERRSAILRAALEVFAERGYHRTAIDDIARAGSVSKALIYEHFSSKEELHLELMEQNARELFERLRGAAAVGGRGTAQRLEAGLDAFFGFVEERRGAWRMLFREAGDPQAAAVLDRITEQVTAVVASLIEEDPAAQGLAAEEPERREGIAMLAQMLVGSAQSVGNWWADHQDLPRERVVELVMDFAWLGLERLSLGERWTQA